MLEGQELVLGCWPLAGQSSSAHFLFPPCWVINTLKESFRQPISLERTLSPITALLLILPRFLDLTMINVSAELVLIVQTALEALKITKEST